MIYVFPRKKTTARKRKNKISRLFPHIRHSFRKKNYCFLLFAACSKEKNSRFLPSVIRSRKTYRSLFRRLSERKRSLPFSFAVRLSPVVRLKEKEVFRFFSFSACPRERKLAAFLSFIARLRKESSSLFFHLSPV